MILLQVVGKVWAWNIGFKRLSMTIYDHLSYLKDNQFFLIKGWN